MATTTKTAKPASFNPLAEKGTPLDRQIRSWDEIVHNPYDKHEIDAYSRARQILINGIEIEGWVFNHSFARSVADDQLKQLLARVRHVEDQQQTTINWLTPADQTILETTLAYEQVAVDLTAWLAQNEPDTMVRQAFDFGLLEDFDHLYRYAQMYHLLENKDPNAILQGKTDVFPGRPTQDHHNDSALRLRKFYDGKKAAPITKVNVLTLMAGEQQTHNFYKAHGFMYGNPTLSKLYAEIGDVEEEHVTQYESLMDPTVSMFEKWLLHEFTEVCNYYTFLQQEPDQRLCRIWEQFLSFELEHLRLAAEAFKKQEKRDPEEVIGKQVLQPSRFESQKQYVAKVLREQIDLRLNAEKGYTRTADLPGDWANYNFQQAMNGERCPSETVVQISIDTFGCDFSRASDDLMREKQAILTRGLDKVKAPNTVEPEALLAATTETR